MSIIKLVNATTGEEIEREMNAEELAMQAADDAAEMLRLETLATKVAEKAALLEKLGITEDEAKLLLS